MDGPGWRPPRYGTTVLGGVLVVGGLLLLAAQYARIDLGHYGWPLLVIVPGLGLLVAGLLVREASGLIVAGTIVTATGLVLAVQNTFDLWATWAYAWALIGPGAVGVGLALQGRIRGSPRLVQVGTQLALLGLGLFVVFGVFFEGAVHLSGLDLGAVGQVALPVALVVVGLLLLATRMLPGRASPRGAGSPPAPPPPPQPPPDSGGR